jgi:hypothetical protein
MNLYHIVRRFVTCADEVARLLPFAASAETDNYAVFHACSIYAIIKLHDLWASHCRQLVICSTDARFTTLSGGHLPRAASLPPKVRPIEWLRHNWTVGKRMKPSWEPDWHVPGQCLRAAQLLRIGNYVTIFNALSATTVTEQIRCTRNAVVHSLPATYAKVRLLSASLGLPRNVNPVRIIYSRVNGTGPLLFDHWISELRLCLEAAIH